MINTVSLKNINFGNNVDSKSVNNSERIILKPEDIDTFVKAFDEQEKNRLKGNKFSKISSSFTAGITSIGVCLVGLGAILYKIKKNPMSLMSSVQKEKFVTNNIRNVLITLLAAAGCNIGINFLHNKNIDKISPKVEDKFNTYNTTSAKLADNHFRSQGLYAKYNIINGEVEFSKDFLKDPIKGLCLDKIIKHELEHAKQFEMIAALDDGIEKLNFTVMKNIASGIKGDDEKEAMFMSNEALQADNTEKSYNAVIVVQGAEVNMKNYIKALATLLQNPEATYKDIPMVIDKKHYLEAVKKRGPLTIEEKAKAEE